MPWDPDQYRKFEAERAAPFADLVAMIDVRERLSVIDLGCWTRHSPVLPIDEYAQLLFEARASDITVIEKVYAHVLHDADALAEWTSGTALVPYFERLPSELREPFMQRYRGRLREAF